MYSVIEVEQVELSDTWLQLLSHVHFPRHITSH